MPAAVPAVAGIAPPTDTHIDFDLWERELATLICTHPVRLRGEADRVNPTTGEVHESYSTDSEPTGVLLKPCGTRRAAICPACAERYRHDAYHLLAAGLRGGKGVPGTVAAHPRLFATFTAPAFGPVHTRRDHAGRVLPCRPRRNARPCPHGRPTDCRLRHHPDDPRIGQPLCARCYNYLAHVLWNAMAPELWRRTRIYLDRALAHLAGLTVTELRGLVRVEYAKVAEYQHRGVIHYHAVLRLDAQAPAGIIQPPPAPFTVELLEQAVRHAAHTAAAPIPGTRRLVARWGDQLDLRPITAGATGALSAELVAGYIAKYATKATETFGTGLQRRLSSGEVDRLDRHHLPPHVVRLVRACWQLGAYPQLRGLRLRRWAHMLGYRGHWTTRSRRYSTTFTALRAERQHHARVHARQSLGLPDDDQAVIVLASWTYAGRGYHHQSERWLALAAAARAREHRRIAREELSSRSRAA
jgi:hypothetical protein